MGYVVFRRMIIGKCIFSLYVYFYVCMYMCGEKFIYYSKVFILYDCKFIYYLKL